MNHLYGNPHLNELAGFKEALHHASSFRSRLRECDLSLNQLGFETSAASEKAITLFESLAPERRQTLIAYLDDLILSAHEPRLSKAYDIFSRNAEVQSIQRHLWRFGCKFVDDDFTDLIDDGDIVEIYNLDGVQTYRSWSCFTVCSYSLSELLIFDWNTLYERPSPVVAKISDSIQKCMELNQTLAYNVPEYLMFERFDEHHHVINFNMKYLTPIVDLKSGEPVAVCSTGKASVWNDRKDDLNITFL